MIEIYICFKDVRSCTLHVRVMHKLNSKCDQPRSGNKRTDSVLFTRSGLTTNVEINAQLRLLAQCTSYVIYAWVLVITKGGNVGSL